MTETTPDYAELIERLEKVEPDTPGEGVTRYYRNPDGPGAAAALRTLLSRAEAAEARMKELEEENERLRNMLEWHPIETVPLDTIVDLWCTYAGAPASWGNGRPTGEIVHNRHKSKKYGWFGNQSDDGVPNGDGTDLLPVAWRWPAPDVPLELMERYIAARRVREGGEANG